MRGDSLRDFYAKVLAVLGLGVLACAGALVDYWPNVGALPRVATLASDRTLAGPLPVPALTTASVRRVASPTLARVSTTLPPSIAEPAATVAMNLDVRPAPLAVAHTLDLGRVASTTLAAPPIAAAPAPEPAMPVVDATNEPAPVALGGGMQMPVATSDEGGFFMGAVRKTKDSIVNTGRRTGASIFDAFRFVGGAMKKALPG